MANYQALADHHSEEIVQLLEDFSAAKVEIARHLQEYEVERKVAALGEVETVELPDSNSNQNAAIPTAQEEL